MQALGLYSSLSPKKKKTKIGSYLEVSLAKSFIVMNLWHIMASIPKGPTEEYRLYLIKK